MIGHEKSNAQVTYTKMLSAWDIQPTNCSAIPRYIMCYQADFSEYKFWNYNN